MPSWIMSLIGTILNSVFGAMRQSTLEENLTTVGRSEVEQELFQEFLDREYDAQDIDQTMFNSVDDLRDSM